MVIFLISLGIIVYLICGRIIVNVLEAGEWIDIDRPYEEGHLRMILFPLLLIWVLIREVADRISDFFIK